VGLGADIIVVFPIMLVLAGNSKIQIPAAIDAAKRLYPQLRFTYGRPVGIHLETLEICAERLQEIGENTADPDPDTAVLLLGRGGSDPDANSDLYKIARLLWERLRYRIVEPAFIGVTDPLVAEGVERCVRLGAKKIVILPYFLFTGVLIKRLKGMMDDFRAMYPQCEFQLAGYFGLHPRLQAILLERIEEALHDQVNMNCDTCQYRIAASEHLDLHHHHHGHRDHHGHGEDHHGLGDRHGHDHDHGHRDHHGQCDQHDHGHDHHPDGYHHACHHLQEAANPR
jgi:sirohydrochlorin cobaltochelatase